MPWMWDPRKNRVNRAKHGLGFEAAVQVFQDPIALSQLDDHSGEERWRTVGRIGNVTVLVIHTVDDPEAASGRIISARKATARERKAYEESSL